MRLNFAFPNGVEFFTISECVPRKGERISLAFVGRPMFGEDQASEFHFKKFNDDNLITKLWYVEKVEWVPKGFSIIVNVFLKTDIKPM